MLMDSSPTATSSMLLLITKQLPAAGLLPIVLSTWLLTDYGCLFVKSTSKSETSCWAVKQLSLGFSAAAGSWNRNTSVWT